TTSGQSTTLWKQPPIRCARRWDQAMADPADVLQALAAQLRDEGTPISPHVVEPVAEPAFGLQVAAGPRAASSPGEYALVIEAVREGYLLHYAEPRLLA